MLTIKFHIQVETQGSVAVRCSSAVSGVVFFVCLLPRQIISGGLPNYQARDCNQCKTYQCFEYSPPNFCVLWGLIQADKPYTSQRDRAKYHPNTQHNDRLSGLLRRLTESMTLSKLRLEWGGGGIRSQRRTTLDTEMR